MEQMTPSKNASLPVKRRPPISSPGNPRASAPVVKSPIAESVPKDLEFNFSSPLPRQPIGAVLLIALAGGLLMTLSLSPFGLGQVAFIATAPWAWLTLDARRLTSTGYLVLFATGVAQWLFLLLLEVDFGGEVLADNLPVILYLAIYVPAFVFLGRQSRQLIRLPAYITLPIIWCGLEWLRCHLFGGFSLGMLAHSAADTRRILQLTDISGSYGLGALMVVSGASVAELLWTMRRIRTLEKHLPQLRKKKGNGQSAIFTAASRFAQAAFVPRGRDKPAAQRSMERAVRRSRDRARELHLTSVTFAVFAMVFVLIFANSYGRTRVVETTTWKLFESNLFVVSVLGGPGTSDQFGEQARLKSSSLLVAALDRPVELPQWDRPVLAISTNDSDGNWIAMLDRGSGDDVDMQTLGSYAGAMQLWSHPRSRKIFAADPNQVPLNLMTTVAATSTIETSVNATLQDLPNHGRNIDVVIVGIDPNPMDGSGWPRLMTRSVIAAAVANRCPVIALIPDRLVAVATGDGKLWWSSAMTQDDSPMGDPEADGKRIDSPISVQAMIDPRVSEFNRIGELLGEVCAMVTLCVPLAHLVRFRRPRRTTRVNHQVALDCPS